MGKVARWGLMLFVGLLVLLAGLIVSVLFRRQIISGTLARSGQPQVMFLSDQFEVVLTRFEQPVRNCPPALRATNIILLLDRSGSMQDTDALAAVVSAAQQFVETVDLTVSEVAIALFNDKIQMVQPLTPDLALLTTALSQPIAAQGSTDIAVALSEAGAVLQGNTFNSSNPLSVIVLLTDGGSDPDQARTVAAALKNAGIRIIAISLQTDDSNPSLLRQLATSSNDFYESPNPSDLQTLYTTVAEQLNQAVAFDVVITEKVNESLTVLPDTLAPNGVVSGNTITWKFPSLSIQPADFFYHVSPNRIGRFALNEEATTMSFNDCIAGAVTQVLAPGPALLVLPPAWSLGILLLLPLLPFLLLSWFRRSSPPSPTPIEPVFEPELPPDRYPAWLRRLDDYRQALMAEEVARKAENLVPTMIVGIGPVGRQVLSEIAQTLRARYGGRLPDPIRLLQIDVQVQGVNSAELDRPPYLLPEEWVLLRPNLAEVSFNLQRNPEGWPYFSWYEPTATEDYARSRGRGALFYDLKDGADRSAVWRGLSRVAYKLQKPHLRLVGSTFDDTSSGMLVDIAWLMQSITNSQVDVELWLCGPLQEDWSTRLINPRQRVRVKDQETRTLATLRELERFQRNAAIPFYYVSAANIQTQLHRQSEAAVIQTMFLFVPDRGQTVDDHLSTIADGLMGIIYKEAQLAVDQHLVRTKARAGILTNKQDMGMVCSLGAFAIRMPLGLLEEALAWRLVYELLFESQVGLLPLAELQKDGSYQSLTPDDLPGNPVQRREEAELFVERFRRRWQSRDFHYALTRRLSDIMNGEIGAAPPIFARVGGIVHARRWLESVRNALNLEGELETARLVDQLREHIEEQQTLLEELEPNVRERWQAARAKLGRLKQQQGRHWVIDEELEWPAYQQRVRSWTNSSTGNLSAESLLRAAQRFGWQVHYHETRRDWQVAFWLPAIDYVWPGMEEAGDPVDFVQPLSQESRLLQRLITLARPLVRNKDAARFALDVTERQDTRLLLSRAEPRLIIDGMRASRLLDMAGGMAEQTILIAPKSDRAQQLQQALKQTPEKADVTLCETDDGTTVTILRLRDRVPLSTCNIYNEETWLNNFVLSGLYVWRGEQLAALVESGQRLSSQFVGWLEQDGQLVDLFARAYLFSLLDKTNRSDLWLPGINVWPGENVGEGLGNLLGQDEANWPAVFLNPRRRETALDELENAILNNQEKIWKAPNMGKRTYQRRAEEQLVQPLTTSSDQREKDLAIYLQAIMKQW